MHDVKDVICDLPDIRVVRPHGLVEIIHDFVDSKDNKFVYEVVQPILWQFYVDYAKDSKSFWTSSHARFASSLFDIERVRGEVFDISLIRIEFAYDVRQYIDRYNLDREQLLKEQGDCLTQLTNVATNMAMEYLAEFAQVLYEKSVERSDNECCECKYSVFA